LHAKSSEPSGSRSSATPASGFGTAVAAGAVQCAPPSSVAVRSTAGACGESAGASRPSLPRRSMATARVPSSGATDGWSDRGPPFIAAVRRMRPSCASCTQSPRLWMNSW
jgi:hypothetical protein